MGTVGALLLNSIILGCILAASAVLFAAAPVVAADFSVSRGEAFAIRSCPIEGDMSRGVCYNQETEWEPDAASSHDDGDHMMVRCIISHHCLPSPRII